VDGAEDWSYMETARPAFALHGVSDRQRLGLHLHDRGHAVPPEAEALLHQWFNHFLA
jgi:hypothetical protein